MVALVPDGTSVPCILGRTVYPLPSLVPLKSTAEGKDTAFT